MPVAMHLEKIGDKAFDAGFTDAMKDSGWGNVYACPKAFAAYSRGYSSGMCRRLMVPNTPAARRKGRGGA